MPTPQASELLRPRLLEGVSVFVAGAPPPIAPSGTSTDALGASVRSACAALGARVSAWRVIAEPTAAAGQGAEPAAEQAVGDALADAGSIAVAVIDAASLFARAAGGEGDGHPDGARSALVASLDATWSITRAVVNLALLPERAGGRIVYLAPAPTAGQYADAALAGLENLSRTLSIEWARYGITAITLAPGAHTPASEVALLTAYLASHAGAYFSGCLLDLRGP